MIAPAASRASFLPGRRRHPAAFVLTCFFGFEGLHLAVAWDDARLFREALPWIPDAWLGPAIWGFYAVVALLLVTILGWWGRIGLLRPGRRSAIRLLAYPFVTGLVFVGLGVNIDAAQVLPILLIGAPLIAINEEVFFRGVVLEGLRPQGWRWAIIGSAALFGVAHTLNLVAGANVPFTFMQVAATTAGGVTLAAIRIRSGSLWPVIALHIGLDVVALSTLTGDGVDSPLLLPVLFAWLALNLTLWAYGWRILRGPSDAELDALYDGADASTEVTRD